MKMVKIIFFIFSLNFIILPSYGAKVTCSFLSETVVTTDGVWVKTEMDFMKLFELFGAEGLTIELENSLLAQLDTQEVFLAGETSLGKVYLSGSEMGITGKNIKVENNLITMYDGMCQVSFGN